MVVRWGLKTWLHLPEGRHERDEGGYKVGEGGCKEGGGEIDLQKKTQKFLAGMGRCGRHLKKVRENKWH